MRTALVLQPARFLMFLIIFTLWISPIVLPGVVSNRFQTVP
jgi:hypothetical protein